MKKLIMLIDDDPTNLLKGKAALQDTYNVLTVDGGVRALELLEKTLPDLILIDIDMPEMDGFETIKRIKANEETKRIPVIFLTALAASHNEYEGLALGAADYITKPFNEKILRKRIDTHLLLAEYTVNLEKLVDTKTEKIIQLQDAILSTVAELVEFRDDNTGGHIDRTQSYIKLLVEKMAERGLYKEAAAIWDLKLLIQSAQLHDVGKICIPDSILNKPGKLTEEEFAIMQSHTLRGKEAILNIINKVDESEFLHQAALMAYTHHERWDGTGYPQGLRGEEIPLHGRLMAIADVYDALISERPYKKPFSHEEAVKIISDGKGTQFDPLLAALFEDFESDFRAISQEDKRQMEEAADSLIHKADSGEHDKMNASSVLIVDDAPFNINVMQSLLAPYKMLVDTCSSGAEAIELAADNEYDIIFMDHFMPEMDGIEATAKIRKINDYYSSSPIIALTANEETGAREMYLENGFNDFIAKPVNTKKLSAVLSLWTSENKDIKADSIKPVRVDRVALLEVFLSDAKKKITEIKDCFEAGNIKLFTTYIHALKSASAIIGEATLSELARTLESQARVGNKDYIRKNIASLLVELQNVIDKITLELSEKRET